MAHYDFDIPVTFRHRIRFTRDAFAEGNPVVSDLLETERERKVVVFIETEIDRLFPSLRDQITSYLGGLEQITLAEIVVIPGG
ncbi:MAG: 3-dehydroquinate synthase, partial [Akkermansiaceae bacterium]|nr:3-dehydroquinate synthase [Akkermansiaceae bacterium]